MSNRVSHCLKLIAVSTLALAAVGCAEAAVQPTGTVEVLSSSTANAPLSEVSPTTAHIWLEAPTGTYQTGWANLWEENGSLFVDVAVSPPEPVAQPAHIHLGSCPQLGAIEHGLENVVGGRSLTELPGVTIEDVATGGMAINLHLSFADFPTFTACGNIPALNDSVQSSPSELFGLAE